MRALYSCLLILLIITGCNHRPGIVANKKQNGQTIVLQPLGTATAADSRQLAFLQKEIIAFCHMRTVIRKPISLPASFLNLEKGKRYCADSILRLLAAQKNDTVFTTIGMTHDDIYTTKYDSSGQVKSPAYKYKVWGIFGLGYRPGVACVISDHRLHTADSRLFAHRLRTVALHEIGHNRGLPHCPAPGCIMSSANEQIATVDNSGNDYCAACRKKLN